MNLKPHQQRVVAELADLDGKLTKLTAFTTSNHAFDEIESAEKQLLTEQRRAMQAYADVLRRRIEFWQSQLPPSPPPVDRTQRTLTDGTPVTADHRELRQDGQQKAYVVLSEGERAKGFVRPVRDSYVHTKCGAVTRMGRSLAETYARDPGFYSGTFCVGCGTHFPLSEFRWDGTNEVVGS